MEASLRPEIKNLKGDFLGAIVVCMAVLPEAIAYSVVVGVNPMTGVYASFVISILTALFGGRPGLISAAASATALVLVNLVKDYGLDYMLAATILAGVIQIILGYLRVGNLMKFIPKPVMIGFMNALGLMKISSQLKYFHGGYVVVVLGVLGIAIVYLFPKITNAIPAPIVAIVTVTIISVAFGIHIDTLGDMGKITGDLPKFFIPNVPLNLETLKIILPYSMSVALIGILESLLTAQVVDELTETSSNKNKECVGLGIANLGAGLFGGIAGCGMIGQSKMNHKYGGRTRLSTAMAGILVLASVMLLNKFVTQIPMVVLAGVMVVMGINTVEWHSIRRMRKVQLSDNIIMITTVVIVMSTHNLAYGVIAGVLASALMFAYKISEIKVKKFKFGTNTKYVVEGQLFFASTTTFVDGFDYSQRSGRIEIDCKQLKVWDESAVDAIDKVVMKFKKRGVNVELVGLSDNCLNLLSNIGIKNKNNELDIVV